MIRGQEIEDLVKLLERRRVSLFHACQYTDFCAYLRLGGIPSRALLERGGVQFTSFETDVNDRQNGVWDKVFVNLTDFGRFFAHGYPAVPNPYGPILLQLHPAALLETHDVAVCLHSAGAKDFNREREALQSVAEVEKLFLHQADADFPLSVEIKPTPQLQTVRAGASAPEISCSIVRGYLPIQYVVVVLTDPYILGGRSLLDWVRMATGEVGARFLVRDRSCDKERREFYDELLRISRERTSLRNIVRDTTRSPSLRKWAEDVEAHGLNYQFQRFSGYLVEGTARPLVNETGRVGTPAGAIMVSLSL